MGQNLEGLVSRGYVPASYEPGDHLFIMPSFFSTMGDLQEGIRTLSEVTAPNEVPKLSPMYCETVPVGKAPPNWEFEAVKHAGASPYFLLAERDENGALLHQHLFLVDNGKPIKMDMPEWIPDERAREYIGKFRAMSAHSDAPVLNPEPKISTNIRMPAAPIDSDPIDLQSIDPEPRNTDLDKLLAQALGPDDAPPLAPESQQVPMPPPGQTTEIRALYKELDKQEHSMPLPVPPPPPPLQPVDTAPPLGMNDVAQVLDEVLPDDSRGNDTEIVERDTERGVRSGIPTERIEKIDGGTSGDTIVQHFGGKAAPLGDLGLPTEMEVDKSTEYRMPNPMAKKNTEEVRAAPVISDIPAAPVVEEIPVSKTEEKSEVPMSDEAIPQVAAQAAESTPVSEKPKRGRFALAVGAVALAAFVGYFGGRAQGGLPVSTEKTFSVKEMNDAKSNYQKDLDSAKSQYQQDSDLLKKDIERLNSELKSAQSALETEKSSSKSSTERVKSLESEVSKLQGDIDKRQKELDKKNSEYALLERALKNSEDNSNSLREQVKGLEKRVATMDGVPFKASAAVAFEDRNVYASALGYLSAVSAYASQLNLANPDSPAGQLISLSRIAGKDKKLSAVELEAAVDEFVAKVNKLRKDDKKPYSKMDIKADYSKKPEIKDGQIILTASVEAKLDVESEQRLRKIVSDYKPSDDYLAWVLYLSSSVFNDIDKAGKLTSKGVDRIESWMKADYKK